jgi:hypothetical protein
MEGGQGPNWGCRAKEEEEKRNLLFLKAMNKTTRNISFIKNRKYFLRERNKA